MKLRPLGLRSRHLGVFVSVTVPIDLGVVEQSQPVVVDVAIPADPVVPLDWVGRGVAVPVKVGALVPVVVDAAIPADPVVLLDWVGRGVVVPVVPEDLGVPCVPVAPGAPFIDIVSEVPCGF